jgi:hypothetical protein
MIGWCLDCQDVIGLGEIMVQFNAVTPGPLRHVTYFEKHAAGAEANVAVCVRRQGLSSGLSSQGLVLMSSGYIFIIGSEERVWMSLR